MSLAGVPSNTVPLDLSYTLSLSSDYVQSDGFRLVPGEYHYGYKETIYSWFATRCSVRGESAIKQEDDLFLPIPTAMLFPTPTATGPSTQPNWTGTSAAARTGFIRQEAVLARQYNPNFHQNNSYRAYKTRAQFPELTNYTLRGLLGLVVKQLPTVDFPSEMQYLEEKASIDGKSLNDMFLYILAEVLITGRIFLLVDIDESDGKLRFALYTAENITDWRSETAGSDDSRLLEIVLLESNNAHGIGKGERALLHLGIEASQYEARKLKLSDVSGETQIAKTATNPEYQSKVPDHIPGVVVGATDLTPAIDKAPISGIARTSIQIYQMDADLRQAEFLTCNPTLVITGVDAESLPTVIGSQVALALPDATCKAYYTETDTSALQHIEVRIASLHDFALQQGASLLGGQKNVSESGEALRIRQASTSATLVSVVYTTGQGIQRILDEIQEWMGVTEKAVFDPNDEFTTYAMTAQEQLALVNSWLEGAISDDTLLDNFRRAGMLHAGDTVEDEKNRGGGKKTVNEDGTSGGTTQQAVAGVIGGSTNKDTKDANKGPNEN